MEQKVNARKLIVYYPTLPGNSEGGSDNDRPKIRVAAYCRVSSASDEQMHSIKAQSDYYTQYISSNADYELVGIFSDEGISGTGTHRREAFRQLLEHCRSGLVDTVVTKSVSRFGRNTVDTLMAIRELKALGVDVFFEKENVHTKNSEGEILLTLMSAIAQSESMALSDNVKWGLRRKYEIGSVKSVPCGKLLGYKKIDGDFVIIEPEAEIVRRIYREFLGGYSISRIAQGLTADDLPSEQGNTVWRLSSIRQILRNEKFKGDILFQKTYNTDHLTKKRAKNNGELHKYYLENSHPAIIDKETWECVRLELLRQENYCKAHHIRNYHNSNEEHPLSARITCATCGRTYILLDSKRVGEDGRKYWRCSSFLGKQWTVVEEKTFTPPPSHGGSTNPYVIKRRKKQQPRQMLCTDIQIPAGRPEWAFVRAWNQFISHRLRYAASLARIASETEDQLLRYRATEMAKLLAEGQRIVEFDYELSLKILDHIEVKSDGKLRVIFMPGIMVTI